MPLIRQIILYWSRNASYWNCPQDLEIKINGQSVERIGNNTTNKTFKFLGIHIYENITWKSHINYICSKISHSNYVINKVKNILPKPCLLTQYQSIVQCHINYGIHLWGSSSTVDRVTKLQKKSLHIINKAIRDGKYLARHMPVLGNVHPLKSNILIFFRDVISLLARVVILLIDTATQEVPMTNIWNKLSVQFMRYAIELFFFTQVMLMTSDRHHIWHTDREYE